MIFAVFGKPGQTQCMTNRHAARHLTQSRGCLRVAVGATRADKYISGSKSRAISYTYLSVSAPCCLSTDPKMHDREWPFYVQFSMFTITNRVELFTEYFLYDVTSKDLPSGQ